jgi:hypothetical protein
MQLLHMEVGGTGVDLLGHWLFFTEVMRYLQGEPPLVWISARRVLWGAEGAKMAVIKKAGEKPIWIATPDPPRQYEADDPDLARANSFANQALGELCVSLGLEPGAGYASPHPASMPKFRWDPPLPGADDDMPSRRESRVSG